MLKLRTVHPYGLNDRVGDEWKVECNQKLIGNQFPKLDRQYSRKSRGNGSHANTLTPLSFLDTFENMLKNDLHNAINYARFTLASMKKCNLKQISSLIFDTIL